MTALMEVSRMAPYDYHYDWSNSTSDVTIYDSSVTTLNSYRGGPYQEAISGVTANNQTGYQIDGGYAIYGVEYKTGSDGYITWINNGKPAWTMHPSAIGKYR